MSASIVTTSNRDFVVVEQKRGIYTPHIFESQEAFREWRRTHPGNFASTNTASGKMQPAVDHRDDWLINWS